MVLRVLCLLVKCSTTWATPPALPYFFVIFVENTKFTYHIKYKTAHYRLVLTIFGQIIDFVCRFWRLFLKCLIQNKPTRNIRTGQRKGSRVNMRVMDPRKEVPIRLGRAETRGEEANNWLGEWLSDKKKFCWWLAYLSSSVFQTFFKKHKVPCLDAFHPKA
jgi:hypothetical protein